MKFLNIMLIFIPISIIAEIMHLSPIWIFILSALAIIPLAAYIGKSTEAIAVYTGDRVGGLLNATLGNATELIISILAIKEGLFAVVKASIAGSVLGNVLLVLGASMLAGGLKFTTQKFNKKAIEVTSTMLLFSIIAITVPAFFEELPSKNLLVNTEKISIVISIILFLIYIATIVFSMITHKDLYVEESVAEEIEEIEEGKKQWSLWLALLVLIMVTIFIAVESEILVSAVEPMTKILGISESFVGLILIPIVGNAAEHSTAVIMALKDKMNVSMEIAVGSSLQIILFVTPILVFVSLFFKPMSIIFDNFELIALISAVIIANKVSIDGESNWLEGLVLIGIYFILAVMFFFF